MKRPSRRMLQCLALLACGSLALCIAIEATLGRLTHPQVETLREASALMQTATQIIRAEKARLGLMQPPEIDPNRTGLIGPEFTELTTTLGSLDAKRTATNPDLAASIARMIIDADVPRDGWVLVFMSGSIVGGNVAVLSALKALDMDMTVINSVGASMYGAGDPGLTWIDMQALLAEAGLTPRPDLVVAGGDGGVASELTAAGRQMVQDAATRNGVQLTSGASLPQLIDSLLDQALSLRDQMAPALVINVGGSSVALGTCANVDAVAVGLSRIAIPCADGDPGLVSTLSQQGAPILHILNLRRFAGQAGLPYDPVPLPTPGDNTRIYGG